MWLADQWKDYEVIDSCDGEKLERWGEYLLVRPDPQVIWTTPKVHPGWKKPNAHYHRSSKGGGEWQFFNLPNVWEISYRNLRFRLQSWHSRGNLCMEYNIQMKGRLLYSAVANHFMWKIKSSEL